MKVLSAALLLLVAASPCFAELVIHTKDGRTFRVQVDPIEISSIEFSPQTATSSAQTLSGRWVGTFHNSLGDSGATTLTLVVNGDKITGSADGDAIQNPKWDGNLLRFSLYSNANKTSYQYEFQLIGDRKAKLTYQASSPTRNYSGYVNDYVRQ